MSDEPLSRLLDAMEGRSVLLLQGPVGPFFRLLADALQARGARVLKVNFNAGDRHYFDDPRAIDCRVDLDDLHDFYRALIADHGIEAIILFGDLRPPHLAARQLASELGLELFAFEEGYLRPDYITLERGGVNARSTLSSDPAVHEDALGHPVAPTFQVGSTFTGLALHSAVYALSTWLGQRDFPRYVHHKDIDPLREAGRWLQGGVRKLRWKLRDRGVESLLSGPLSGRYYFVPLQVWNDFQIRESSFPTVEAFLRHVVATFARAAHPEHHLVVKHHPMDRAYRDYTAFIAELARTHGLAERLHYVADSHLPTVLKHARGTILVNSTVGLSSLHHGTPVFATDAAPYTRAGLAYAGTLEDFLRDPGEVDRGRVRAFEAYLRQTCQVNGSFYAPRALPQALRPPGGGGAAPWPRLLRRPRRATPE